MNANREFEVNDTAWTPSPLGEGRGEAIRRKGNLLLIACFLLLVGSAYSQSTEEALRYSELRFGGSARGMAVAGAMGAIGADYSSVINNPAGLGLFRKTELMFTFRFENMNTESQYDNGFTSDNRFNFNVGNLGAAFAGKKERGGWKNINFGIGYNRLANYHAERYYRGNPTDNSILQSYADEATGTPADQLSYGDQSFESVLAYDAYLINPLPSDITQYTTVTDNADVDQRINVETRGATDELSFAVAGNYKHKLYVGGYLGIPFIFYKERGYHRETSLAAGDEVFNSFTMNDQLNTFGAGVNFKMGLIYRPSDWVRLGAAFHTPTYFGIRDEYSSSVTVSFDTLPNPDLVFPITYEGEFDYNLTTPMRFVGSVGVILKKYAFLSFDYEWVDYSRAQYHTASELSDFEKDVNEDIAGLYGSAHIFRAGAEAALDNFRFRAGYAHYGSPYENAAALGDYDGSANYFTGGIGIRLKKVYFDLAYVHGKSKSVNLAVNDELAYDEAIRNSVMITTGFRF